MNEKKRRKINTIIEANEKKFYIFFLVFFEFPGRNEQSSRNCNQFGSFNFIKEKMDNLSPFYRCWCVRICSTKLCLCLDFLWQIGHSNCGSTPHSKRIWRFKLCGLAYELPHCLHMKILLCDTVERKLSLVGVRTLSTFAFDGSLSSSSLLSLSSMSSFNTSFWLAVNKRSECFDCRPNWFFLGDDRSSPEAVALLCVDDVDCVGIICSGCCVGASVVTTGSDSSCRHVAGVNKRKSHGWSYDSSSIAERKRSLLVTLMMFALLFITSDILPMTAKIEKIV